MYVHYSIGKAFLEIVRHQKFILVVIILDYSTRFGKINGFVTNACEVA